MQNMRFPGSRSKSVCFQISCRGGYQPPARKVPACWGILGEIAKRYLKDWMKTQQGRTDSLACGRATAVASVHRTLAKSRLSNPPSQYPNAEKDQSFWIGLFLVGEDGFEPSKRNAADLQSVPFGHSGTPPYSVKVCRNRTCVLYHGISVCQELFYISAKKSAGLG